MAATERVRPDRQGEPPVWLIFLVVAAALAVLVSGVLYYQNQERSLRERAQIELETIAGFKVDQIVSWREQHLKTAQRLTDSRLYAQIIDGWLEGGRSGSTDGIVARMRAEKPSGDYFDVILADPQGVEILRLADEGVGIHQDTVAAVRSATAAGRPLLTDLHKGVGNQRAHIDVVAPLYFERDGELISPGTVILASSADDFLHPLVKSWPTPSTTAETALVVRDGDSVLFLNDLRHAKDAALSLRVPLTVTDNPAVMAVTGSEGIVEAVDYRGERVLAYVTPVPDSDWYMVAKIDVAEALSDWRSRSIYIVLVVAGLLVMILGGFGAVWQGSRASYLTSLLDVERAEREGQEKLLSLFRAAPMGLGITHDRVFTDVSDRFCEMVGYSRTELLGSSSAMIYRNEEEHELVGSELMRRVEEEGTGTVETVFVNAGGIELDVMIRCAPIDPEDLSRGTSFAALDITDRKRNEEEVRSHNDLLEAMVRVSQARFESSETHLRLALDEAIGLTGAMHACFYYYDAEHDEITREVIRGDGGGPFEAGACSGIRLDDRKPLNRVLLEGSATTFSIPNTGPEGSAPDEPESFKVLAVPVEEEGRIVAVAAVTGISGGFAEAAATHLSVLMDGAWKTVRRNEAEAEVRRVNASLEQIVLARTEALQSSNRELTKVAEELKETNKCLIEANEAKTNFLRAMSHELRTPLNSIIGFSGIMLDGLTGSINHEQRHQLEMVNRSGRHLLDLINDILDLSRIEAGKVDLSIESFDVQELASDTLQAITPAAEERGLSVRLELPGNGDCRTMTSDPVKVRQVLLNLLGNAVKFTDTGTVTLRLECGSAEGMIGFAVCDTGPGIPDEHHESIFGEFTQRQRRAGTQHQGTGLGLAISRGLAAVLGGTIALQSRVGEGSTFTLFLPVDFE